MSHLESPYKLYLLIKVSSHVNMTDIYENAKNICAKTAPLDSGVIYRSLRNKYLRRIAHTMAYVSYASIFLLQYFFVLKIILEGIICDQWMIFRNSHLKYKADNSVSKVHSNSCGQI